MKVMKDAIDSGRAVMLYPEGTAHRGDEVRELRAGAFKLARDTGADIIPIGIAYADHDMSFGDETFVEHMKRAAVAPRIDVGVAVGAPLRASDASVEDLRDRAREALQDLVNEARALL